MFHFNVKRDVFSILEATTSTMYALRDAQFLKRNRDLNFSFFENESNFATIFFRLTAA